MKKRSSFFKKSRAVGFFLASLMLLGIVALFLPAAIELFRTQIIESSSSLGSNELPASVNDRSDPLIQSSQPNDSNPAEAGEQQARNNLKVSATPEDKTGRYLFGVISDEGKRFDDLWARGVRATTLEFKWRLYEPREGEYDQDYIQHMQAIMRTLKDKGFFVQMIPGFHYAPEWVFENYPDFYYVNQFGERYDPDPVTLGNFRVINAPFNPAARDLISGYLARIFSDFDQTQPSLRFDSVRIGGGVQGELRYPPALTEAHPYTFWAFDPVAQDPSLSDIPPEVVGWRPQLDPNPGSGLAGQLLINPGFEESNPDFPLLGWSPDALITATLTDERPHSGNYALKLEMDGPHRIHQYVRVEPEGEYQIRGWMRADADSGSVRLFVSQENAGHERVDGLDFVKLELKATEWQQLEATFKVDPETRFLKIELDGSKVGTYFFDDLELLAVGKDPEVQRNIEIPLAFYNWYVQKLSDYQNWQIAQIRQYFDGQLDLVYAGKGSNLNAINDALVNDLLGDSWSENGRALYAGTYYPRLLASLDSPGPVAVYLTGIEDPPHSEVDDLSPDPGDWSAAHWLAYLASCYELPIWAENSGENSTGELYLSAERMQANGLFGLMWGFESELYTASGDYATINDLEEVIQSYNEYSLFLPVCNWQS